MALPASAAARELAIRLLTREGSGPPRSNAADAAAGTPDRVCAGVSDELSRWIGRDGCRALFARALATAQASGNHPALESVRVSTGSVSCLDGLAEAVARSGPDAAAAGTAAILSELIDLLGRLIGEDMALSLLAHSASAPRGTHVSPRRGRGAT